MSERPGRCSGRCPRLQRKKALAVADRDVVDGSFAALHQAMFVELPLLVAVGAKPGAGPVVELVDEPDGDAVAGERPDRLDQTYSISRSHLLMGNAWIAARPLKNSERLRHLLSF